MGRGWRGAEEERLGVGEGKREERGAGERRGTAGACGGAVLVFCLLARGKRQRVVRRRVKGEVGWAAMPHGEKGMGSRWAFTGLPPHPELFFLFLCFFFL